MASCHRSVKIVTFWQGGVIIIIRAVCFVLGFSAFVCAATAVNHLNANAIILRDVEDSRDQTVATAGIVTFLGLLTMLLEGVLVLLHFCTKGVLNAIVDIIISAIFAASYLSLGVPMAVFAARWRDQPSSLDVISTIHDSLAAASVFCFLSVCALTTLTVWMCLFVGFKWTSKMEQALESSDTSTPLACEISGIRNCSPVTTSWQCFVEVSTRSVCIVLGLPTFVCAAVAASNLNANANNLRDVEDSRDRSVTAAGMFVGVALVSMLVEGAITAMRFCTKGGVIGFVDTIFSSIVAMMYFSLATSTAKFSDEWRNLERFSGGSGDIPGGINTIADSLAATTVFGFFSMFMFCVLAVLMCILAFKWNPELVQTFKDREHGTSVEMSTENTVDSRLVGEANPAVTTDVMGGSMHAAHKGAGAEVLGMDDLHDITNYLHELGKSEMMKLGLNLGLAYQRIKSMMDSSNFLEDVVAAWLQKADNVQQKGIPTWERLVEALKQKTVSQHGIACKIEKTELSLKNL